MSTELATTTSALPAMPVTSLENAIGAEDIALPRVKMAQFNARAVQDQLVKPGVLYATLGQDDPEPVTLWDPKSAKEGEGLLFHVLHLRKGWSKSVEGDLETWRYDDPTRPDDAWLTYDYTVCLPEVDAELPYKILFTKTGRSSAQKMNLQLKRTNEGHALAWRMETKETSNDKGRFFVPRVVSVKADKKNIAAAVELLAMVAPAPAATPAPATEPGI